MVSGKSEETGVDPAMFWSWGECSVANRSWPYSEPCPGRYERVPFIYLLILKFYKS